MMSVAYAEASSGLREVRCARDGETEGGARIRQLAGDVCKGGAGQVGFLVVSAARLCPVRAAVDVSDKEDGGVENAHPLIAEHEAEFVRADEGRQQWLISHGVDAFIHKTTSSCPPCFNRGRFVVNVVGRPVASHASYPPTRSVTRESPSWRREATARLEA